MDVTACMSRLADVTACTSRLVDVTVFTSRLVDITAKLNNALTRNARERTSAGNL